MLPFPQSGPWDAPLSPKRSQSDPWLTLTKCVLWVLNALIDVATREREFQEVF